MADKLVELRVVVRFDDEQLEEGKVFNMLRNAHRAAAAQSELDPTLFTFIGSSVSCVSAIADRFGSRDSVQHGDYRLLLLRRSDTPHIDSQFWMKTSQLAHLIAEIRVIDDTIEMDLTKNRYGERCPVRDGKHLFELVQTAMLAAETKKPPDAPPAYPAA